MNTFKGRVVLVTGATRGLGKTMARRFFNEGATLIITGTSPKAQERPHPRRLYWQLDLADAQSVDVFLAKMAKLSRLDVLVNNAGMNIVEPIDTITLKNWEKVLQVNLTGAMRLMQQAAILMKKRRQGKILNISSIFGLISRTHRNSYSASKAGLIGLTHAAALDLAPYNICVNALCPGFVLTDLTKRILSKNDQAQIKRDIPMGRFGTEEDVAATAVFLCSDASSYLTGQTIVVDGGYSIQ